jgi:hypothetical protein
MGYLSYKRAPRFAPPNVSVTVGYEVPNSR